MSGVEVVRGPADGDEDGRPAAAGAVPAAEGAAFEGEAPRLRIEGEIGAGAMGVVLAVRDEVLRRDLAMKRVRTDSGDVEPVTREVLSSPSHAPLLVRRLLEEAQVTAQLDHPGVVPVHELGIDERGRAYFTMKRVHGRTLEAVMREGRETKSWPLGRALQTFTRICETLAYAHKKGVVHRDVKPGNVMVGRYGEVYVMDWGLAKVREDATPSTAGTATPPPAPASIVHTLQSDLLHAGGDSPMTMDGQLIGTIGYMAPEQVGGGAIDERADVYSVGAMLYELLAGHAPFTGPDAPPDMPTLIARLFGGEPAPLEVRAPHAPPELVSIAKKAMSRDRAARFASAAELADELHAFLEGRVVRSHRTGVWVEVRSWARRHRWLAAGLGAGVVVVAGAVTAFVAQQRSAAVAIGIERDAAVRAAERAEAAHRRSDGLRLAAQSASVIERDPGLALAMAVDAAGAAPGPEANTAIWRVLRTHRERLYLAGHEGYVNSVRFLPGGKRLVSTDESGGTIVWDLERGTGRSWFDVPGGSVLDSALLADGRTFATAQGDGTVRVLDLETGAEKATVREPATSLAAGEGSTLWTADAAGRVRRHDLSTGTHEDVAAHAGGAWFARGGAAGAVRVASLGADDVLLIHGAAQGRVEDPAAPVEPATPTTHWARVCEPAGRVFARFASGAWRLVSLDGGKPLASGRPEEVVGDAAFSGDGRRLFVLLRGKTVMRLEVRDPADGALVKSFEVPNKALVPSPDGALVAFVGSLDTEVFDVETGTERCRLRGHRYHVRAGAWSPDGRSLATASHDSTVRVWEIRRETEREGLVPRVRAGERVRATSDDAGTALVSAGRGATRALEAVDPDSGRVLAHVDVSEAGIEGAGLDPAGRRFWWMDGTTFRAVDLRAGRPAPPLPLAWPADARAPGRAFPSPDGRRIAVQSGDPLLVFDAQTGALLSRIGTTTTYNRPAWHPDGRRIALSHGQEGEAGLYDAQSGALLRKFRGHTGYLLSLAFDPAGSRLATAAVDSSVRVSDVATGRLLSRIGGFPLRDIEVAYGPEGKALAVSTSDLMLFDGSLPGDPAESGTLARGADQRDLRLHPDGRRFWTTDDEMRVRFWDLDARAQGERELSRPALPQDRVGFDGARALAADGPSARFLGRDDPWWQVVRAGLLMLDGRAAEALAAADAAVARRPRWARASLQRARALAALAGRAPPGSEPRGARLAEARAELERFASLSPAPNVRGAGAPPAPEFRPLLADPALRALLRRLDVDLGDEK